MVYWSLLKTGDWEIHGSNLAVVNFSVIFHNLSFPWFNAIILSRFGGRRGMEKEGGSGVENKRGHFFLVPALLWDCYLCWDHW